MKAQRFTFSVDFTTGSDLSAEEIHGKLSGAIIEASDWLIDVRSIQVQPLQPLEESE